MLFPSIRAEDPFHAEPPQLLADFIIGSDVWEFSSLLRGVGIHPHHPRAGRTYPSHYQLRCP
ncbi:MAG: hypothetical protein M3Y27_04460 [Acidobacteriota bacterium]|nr:hypothetical protein [Acidobacteriota bacterium]